MFFINLYELVLYIRIATGHNMQLRNNDPMNIEQGFIYMITITLKSSGSYFRIWDVVQLDLFDPSYLTLLTLLDVYWLEQMMLL